MSLLKPIRDPSFSEIERKAKRAVVDAVEERWRRQDRQRKREALRRTMRSAFSVVLLVVIGVGAAFCYVRKPKIGRLSEKVLAAMPVSDESVRRDEPALVPAPLLEAKPKKVGERVFNAVVAKPDPGAEFRERYLRLIAVFSKKAEGPWTDAPASIRPKNAPNGTVYHALIPRRPVGYDIYEMTTGADGMTYDLMSPIAKSVRVKAADFSAARKGRGCLIEYDGHVYTSGKASEAQAAGIQEQLKAVHE